RMGRERASAAAVRGRRRRRFREALRPAAACSSFLDQWPGRYVEIVGHRHVDEAARVAQRAGEVTLALRVVGEDEIAGAADEPLAAARFDLENAAGQEDELPPRRVVPVLHESFGGLAEAERARLEARRGWARPAHRHLANLDRRFTRRLAVDSHD